MANISDVYAKDNLDSDLGRKTVAKVLWRIIPLLIVLYFINQVDRVNISFAALTMNKDLGLDPAIYGLGAGIFFVGYFFFEVPSNLLLVKVGPRFWIARIMVTWGLVSAGTAFVTGPYSFYAMRFLLGLAEAGFLPGLVYYLTFWIPARSRALAYGLFFLAIPLSPALAGPLSGYLLGWQHFGLVGWQWMFIAEGVPAVVLGIIVLFYLTDTPRQASWLSSNEVEWLEHTINSEKDITETKQQVSLKESFFHPAVIALCAIYFCSAVANNGTVLWLPQIIKGFGLSNQAVGFINAVPFALGAVASLLWARHSDRTKERRWHIAIPALLTSLGCVLAALSASALSVFASPVVAMLGFCAVAIGIYAYFPVFWSVPSTFLTGTARASAIALINSFAALGGFVGPTLVGWLKSSTGDFTGALFLLALFPLAIVPLILTLKQREA